MRSDKARRALHHPHSLALEEAGDRAVEATDDAVDPVLEPSRVDVRGDHLETHALDALGEAQGATGGDHRLRRDAVPEVSGTADDVALHHRDLGPQTSGMCGGRVPGGTPAEDHE